MEANSLSSNSQFGREKMFKRAIIFGAALAIGSPYKHAFSDDYVGSFLPKYLNDDGSVDSDRAKKILRKLDCDILASYQTLDAQRQTIEMETAKLNAMLKPDITGNLNEVVQDFGIDVAIESAKQVPIPQVQALARGLEKVMLAKDAAEFALNLVQKSMNTSSIETYRSNISAHLDALDSDLKNHEVLWKHRQHYKDDLSLRGVPLDPVFYVSCNDAGAWKIVSSTQTAGGETFDDDSGGPQDCEEMNAQDAEGFISKIRAEGPTPEGCSNGQVTRDDAGLYETQSVCPWQEMLSAYSSSTKKVDDETVQQIVKYAIPNQGDVLLSFTYKLCK